MNKIEWFWHTPPYQNDVGVDFYATSLTEFIKKFVKYLYIQINLLKTRFKYISDDIKFNKKICVQSNFPRSKNYNHLRRREYLREVVKFQLQPYSLKEFVNTSQKGLGMV
jgi:hypothetical protein